MKRVNTREGVAAVELAVCLPVLVFLVFASIEASHGIFLKQAATAASYEAARMVTAPGGLEATAAARGEEVLVGHGVSNGTITISPKIDSKTPRGTNVTVTASIPLLENMGGMARVFKSQPISASVIMVKQ